MTDTSATSSPSVSTVIAPEQKSSTSKSPETRLDRWVDLQKFEYGTRYRSTFNYENARTFDQGQQKLVASGKIKFDRDGRYGLGLRLSSGRQFNWAYAEFIGGGEHAFIQNAEARMSPFQLQIINASGPFPAAFYNSGGGQLYLRELYLTAQPIKGVEMQFGGLSINHGVNSEATSYDDDGYMAGERLTIRRPTVLYLSEISVTRGYVGDFYQPNFFARGYRLAGSNYWQILGRKDFGRRLAVSADYTHGRPEGYVDQTGTTREAIYADVHESKVVDSVRLETYQRLDTMNLQLGPVHFVFHDAKGYAFTMSRSFRKRFSLDAGIANIDNFYFLYAGNNPPAAVQGLAANGDSFGLGQRYFVRPTIPLTKAISLAGYYSHIYHDTPPDAVQDIWNAQALNAGIVVDVKKMFFSRGVQ